MSKTLDIFAKELNSLRTDANASMLDLVKVDVYGQKYAYKSIRYNYDTRTPYDKHSNMDLNNVAPVDQQ